MTHPDLMPGLQRSSKIMTKHKMKEQYKIEETLSVWLRSVQDTAMLLKHITI